MEKLLSNSVSLIFSVSAMDWISSLAGVDEMINLSFRKVRQFKEDHVIPCEAHIKGGERGRWCQTFSSLQ